ncbi:hypothetical protein POM88_020888 [Heracleum sosnowskyi]|uniref:Transposase-associated domain-containing protein n=1 Tax=Heracleum sosnowskyi TaxID=360622 RepID=A0AAD8IDH0_9APIA|nr:hypothetical protein POM88_020888 [Heracleum sosnowskyi]
MEGDWIGLPRFSKEYVEGIKAFVENAFPLFSVGDEMKCPCKNCNDQNWHRQDVIYDHLICTGPSPLHVHWICEVSQKKAQGNSDFMESETGDGFGDKLEEMFNCVGKNFQNVEDEPNAEARKFSQHLEEGKQPLYPGCEKFSRLSFLIRLYHLKCIHGISNSGFGDLLLLIKDAFPQANVPLSFNAAKTIIKDLGLDYQKIHACPNSYKEKYVFCQILKNVKMPYGCASNVSRYVNEDERKIVGFLGSEEVNNNTDFGRCPKNVEYHIGTRRNKDGIFFQLEDFDWKACHTYNLFNSGNKEIETLLEDHRNLVAADATSKRYKRERTHSEDFWKWLKVEVAKKETVKRAFVSSHQLQQQRNYKKIARSPQMQELRPEPVNTRPEPVNTRPEPVNTRGMTKRKLDLSKNTNVEQPMNPYELARLNRVQQNKEKFNELGLGKYASNPSQPSVEESKTKNKNGEEDDEYVPIEDEIETEDERIKSIKERISKPGPRTRSRANATDLGDKDMRNAIEKEGKQVDTAKILKPTCSKLLKAADNSVPSGSVAAYIALRERQKQNLEADPMIENDVGESSLQPADEVVEAGPKKRRGRSKMLKVHARTVNEKVVIKVNKKGQPIGDRKLKAERTKEVDAGIYFAKYWSDGEVQSFAEDNKARRNSYVETHTLGPKSYAEVKNKLKNKDPNHASPSDARMYLKSRGN